MYIYINGEKRYQGRMIILLEVSRSEKAKESN